MHSSNRPFWLLWMRFMWQWEQGSLESVICPGTHNVSPPGSVPPASLVAGAGHSLLLKWLACFKASSFSYRKLLLFSICSKSFLPNLSNLGNTNSPDIIMKVKNILKCWLYDFSRCMSSNRAKMLLLYGKCFLCLTGTSWSSSVLKGEGEWAHRLCSVWNSALRIGANLSSFTPADRPHALTEGQLAAGLSHGVLSFVVHDTRNSNMFSQGKMKGNLVWGMDF